MFKKCLAMLLVIFTVALASATTPPTPDGFVWYETRKGDSLATICRNDPTAGLLTMKINHFDQNNFPVGEKILRPVDINRALEYTPVPRSIESTSTSRRIVIYLDRQYFGAYENGQLVLWGPTSTGREGHQTRTGKYQIRYKERYKRSRKYGNAPMPFSLNLSDTDYFLHEQELPGYRASHGCIRLLRYDAERLFNWAQVGDPVTILRKP